MSEPRDADRDTLKALFFAALDKPAAQRQAFLASLRVDAETLRHLRKLLAANDRAGTFLETPASTTVLGAAALPPGSRVGPYEIIDLIGEGGMGEVFRARDTRLGRQVAIKVLPPEFSQDASRRKRFEAEARVASALNHPNIFTVYDIGVLEGTAGSYLVMELLEGETVHDRLQRDPPLTRDVVLDYALQTAQGLAAAHAAGVIHRDIKPGNLFVTRDGRVKILDFGVAKMLSSADVARTGTKAGTVIGTLGYIAPEQARGQKVDVRSDIFAYGAVLFEMATGTRAFSKDSAIETLNAILEIDPLERMDAAWARDPLSAVVQRCLAKEPADRYQSTPEIVAALEYVRRHDGSTGWWRSTFLSSWFRPR